MEQTRYETDSNNQEVLISDQEEQVMMEWEKPYMEACIDALKPTGDVLEIGFGCAYSANKIQEYNPKSHTIIECDLEVLKRLHLWADDKPNVIIVEGRWQDTLHTLGLFDEIFMDDFPLDLKNDESNFLNIHIKNSFRLYIFIDMCLRNHTRVGSKISAYLNGGGMLNNTKRIKECATIETTFIDVEIPQECRYRDSGKKKCSIPIVTKTQPFNLYESLKNEYVREWTIRELVKF